MSREKRFVSYAQTTFNYNKFKELVEILEKKSYDIIVLNTICNATEERQTEAQQHSRDGGCYDRYWWQTQFQYAEVI